MRPHPSSRRLSVRARTALAAALALGPVLAVLAIGAVALQRGDLTASVALVAEEQARSVARQVDSADTADLPFGASLAGEETLVQVVGADGTVLRSSAALAGQPALAARPGAGELYGSEQSHLIEGEGDTYEVVAVRTSRGWVVAARSTEAADAATQSTARLLAIGVPGIVGLVAALSWVLAGRALRPVEQLRSRAASITEAGTGARLPEVASSDEIGRLAETLNQMLTRLDSSASAQRQFVADASHELRSPIAAIQVVMEVAGPVGTDWDEVRADVLQETARLDQLVTGLLALARRDQDGSRPAVRVRMPLLDLVQAETSRARRLPVSLQVRDSPTVEIDPEGIVSALRNVLDNAERHARATITVKLSTDGSDALITVGDDGDGIPALDQDRIFDRFVRLDEARARMREAPASGSRSHDRSSRTTAELSRSKHQSVRAPPSRYGSPSRPPISSPD